MSKKDSNDIIIDLIHQRSVAFDYGREQAEMLAVAIEALEFYAYHDQQKAKEALKQIEEMKKKSNGK